MKLITYLNMHRARLGYVNCVLLVADIQLDTVVSMRRRLDNLLYHPISTQEPVFENFRALIADKEWEEIQKLRSQRVKRTSKKPRRGLIQDSRLEDTSEETYNIADLWLFQSCMRSTVGRVLPEYSENPIGLSQDLGFLSQGYALTEVGNLTKLILLDQVADVSPKSPQPNPLIVFDDPRLRLMYLYSLLLSDVGFLALLESLSGNAIPESPLRDGLDRLLTRISDTARLDEVDQMRHVYALRNRMDKRNFSRTGREEEPVEKAQTVPRLEFCVDLGLLERSQGGMEEEGRYKKTEATRAIPNALRGLVENPHGIQQWLDKQFFGACGLLYGRELLPISNPNQRLLYFVKGSSFVGRRLGFTPGRIAGLAASLTAWVDGFRLELAEIFDDVYQVPRGPWADFIKFSGGSRLDTEFLVTIDPSLEKKLQAAISTSCEK